MKAPVSQIAISAAFRERIAEAIAEAHDLDSGVDAVMRVIRDESGDPACSCPAGPYIGTQAYGEPVRCERCGDLAPTSQNRTESGTDLTQDERS